jgi:hypothetical protein
MGNAFYDFDPGFLGIGPSYRAAVYRRRCRLHVDGVPQHPRRQRRAGWCHGFRVFSDDRDGSFAYQGIAGIAVPFTGSAFLA